MKTRITAVVIIFATLVMSSPAISSEQNTVNVQLRYQDLLLNLRGVKYVTTAMCEEETGELVTGLRISPPLMDCIAVRVKRVTDLPAIEAVYPNPLRLDGILIHFTDQDPIPSKGGITVHN